MNNSPSSPPPPYDRDGVPTGYTLRPEWEVTPSYVRDRLRQHRSADTQQQAARPFMLLDCRRDDELHICRIDGMTWVPMHEIEARLDELELDPDDTAASRGPRDHEIVIYCHHGRRSLRVASTLRGHGFTHAKSMAGGIDAWASVIDPSVPRY